MPGKILLSEQAIVTFAAGAAALASGSGALVGTLDCRAGGNAPDMFAALFSLQVQWATVTGIAAGTSVADLYLVPVLDGATVPDVDMTGGASYVPFQHRVGGPFVAAKAQTAATNALFQSGVVELMPVLYNVYIINRSGQTISSGWTLKALAAAAQYT